MQKKPRLGQNFLVDANACQRVVAALGNIAQDSVLEIGPGRGAITRLLAPAAGNLSLIEFDPTLAAALAAGFATKSSVEVRHADILTFDLTALAREQGRKLVVVGNLPYYITSDILLHLIAHHAAIDRAVLMVQREVAERLFASPRTKDYGAVSVLVQLAAERTGRHPVSREVFRPRPNVDSALVAFRRKELPADFPRVKQVVTAAFAHRRKTLPNSLAFAGVAPREQAATALAAIGYPAETRAEALEPGELVALTEALR